MVSSRLAVRASAWAGWGPPDLPTVYARMRGGMIDDWNRQQTDCWDCAVRGSSALQSALLRALCFEVAGNQSFESLAVHWDMEKFLCRQRGCLHACATGFAARVSSD
eukprot:9189126-Pyramimonas_sp.AAC.1